MQTILQVSQRRRCPYQLPDGPAGTFAVRRGQIVPEGTEVDSRTRARRLGIREVPDQNHGVRPARDEGAAVGCETGGANAATMALEKIRLLSGQHFPDANPIVLVFGAAGEEAAVRR